MHSLDIQDQKILQILQRDGRASASHISEEVGLSVPAVGERMKKLQESGVISGYQVVLNPKILGYDVGAFITIISESSAHFNEVVENAKKTPQVLQCYTTTGAGSHIVYVVTQNTSSLETLLREIQSWPGVTRTITNVVLSSFKDFNTIPVDAVIENNKKVMETK